MLDKFYNYLRYELNRAQLTVDAYMSDIRQFSEWLNPDDPESIDFTSVTSSDIRAWLAYLARNGIISRSIRRKSQSLRALFRWLQKSGMIKVSPLRDIPLPKIPKPLPDLVRPEEIESAIDITQQNDSEEEADVLKNIVLEMLYSLGLRRAELIALDDRDISFQKSEIKVTGKRSKQRVIPVPFALLEKIKLWQKVRDKNEGYIKDDSPLFLLKGKRITPNQVYYIVKQSLASSSAKKKSPHALRHSFASGMLNGGADLDAVKEFLGHASLATTQIYTHVSLNEIKKAYKVAHPRSGDKNKS